MTDCRNCRRDTELFLCTLCAKELHALLADLPWLCEELEVTVVRQDKLATGVIGRGSDNPSPINVGAMELARNLHNQLGTIVRELLETAGRTDAPADRNTAMARWLYSHHHAIVCHPYAGQTMREIRTGTEAILGVINRVSRMYCGPCTTVTGHRPDGTDIECGIDLYADRDNLVDIQCPKCKTWIEPRRQLLTTITRRDLLTKNWIIEAMAHLDEEITPSQFDGWFYSGRIRIRGYLHHGRIVPKRVRKTDERVFSLTQARQLRRNSESSQADDAVL